MAQREKNVMVGDSTVDVSTLLGHEMCHTIELQPGLQVGLYRYSDHQSTVVASPVSSDEQYIHFNYFLQGELSAKIKGKNLRCSPGDINMGFAGCESFYIHECHDFSNLEIMVRPELLYTLAGEALTEIDFDKELTFFIREGISNKQATQAMTRVVSLLKQGRDTPMLLNAAILEYLYWHLCALKKEQPQSLLSTREKKQVVIAKDYLLADLSAAPTIAELAKAVGVNQCKLKRGFKTLFGKSIYACFQEERMRHAMDLLKCNNVTDTAVTLGYSNISHFSTAFRKQFGVLPKDARRELMYDAHQLLQL